MWGVLRCFDTNLYKSFGTPWVTLRCATCVVLIFLIYGHTSSRAAFDEEFGSSAPPTRSLHLPGDGPSAQRARGDPSDHAKRTARGAKNESPRHAGSSVHSPLQGASATIHAAEKLSLQKAEEKTGVLQEVARTRRYARRRPDPRSADREQALELLVRKLNSANRQTSGHPLLPMSKLNLVLPVRSISDSQRRTGFSPPSPPDDGEIISQASAHSVGSDGEAPQQETKRGTQRERESAARESLPTVAITNAAATASVGKEQHNDKGQCSDKGARLSGFLNVIPASLFSQESKLSADTAAEHKGEAEETNKYSTKGNRQPAITHEPRGDTHRNPQNGKDETRGAKVPETAAAGLDYKIKEPAGEKKAGENDTALQWGERFPLAGSKAEEQGMQRDGEDDSNIERTPPQGAGEDRKIVGEKVQNGNFQALTRAHRKGAEGKGNGQWAETSLLPLPLPHELNLAGKGKQVWPAVPRAPLFGGSFGPMRHPSLILRQKAAKVREAHKWKDDCRARGWKMCGKKHNAAKINFRGFAHRDRSSSDTDAYAQAWTHRPLARPLPRTSSTSASASQQLESSVQKKPRSPSGQGVTQTPQLGRGGNASNAALFNDNVPYPLQSIRNSEDSRTAEELGVALSDDNMPYRFPTDEINESSKSHIPAFDVWHPHYVPVHNVVPHPYRGVTDMPHMELTEFPFPHGPLSIPSSTSTMSGVFGGVRKIIRPLPPMTLDSSESPARYVESGGRGNGQTEADSDLWAGSHTSHSSALHPHSPHNGASIPSAAENEAVAHSQIVQSKELPRKRREGSKTKEATAGGGAKVVDRQQLDRQAEKARVGKYTRSRIRTKKNIMRRGPLERSRHRKPARTKRVWKQTRTHEDTAGGTATHHHPGQRPREGGPPIEENFKSDPSRVHSGHRLATVPRFARAGKLKTATKRSKRRSGKRTTTTKRAPIVLPAKDELVVDEIARVQVGKRAERLRKEPLIERTSTECLDAMSKILTPGMKVTFEPRPNVPEDERFDPMTLVWGHPLGAGANGIVYEVLGRNQKGERVRYALKIALNRHQSICNAWTREKRGELTPPERTKFAQDVRRVCYAEYETEMRQRRLLALPAPSPPTVSKKTDVGKLFAENKVCVPLAVGRIRGLPEYMVCTGGNVAVVNVAGLTPAASCNLYQILAAFDLSVAEKYELTRQVITAVSNVHRIGLLHKDLKSENLLVTSRGEVVVADLAGAEPLVRGESGYEVQFDPGTVTFVAPERAAARLGRQGATAAITVKANSWSLGMIVYEIWCKGIDPFHLEKLTDKEILLRLDNMLRRRYPLSFSSCPPVPRTAQKLISTLLQANPRRRKTPAQLMWTHPLLRKVEFLGRSVEIPRRTK